MGGPSPSQPLAFSLSLPSEMEQQPIRDHGRPFEAAHGPFILRVMNSQFWIGILYWEMAEESGQITHIFEREEREFQDAMRGQVGTTFSCINSSNKMEPFQTFTGAGIITHCTARKNPGFRPCLPLSGIDSYKG